MTPAEERSLRTRLRRENEYLLAERDRYIRLLTMTLRVASRDGQDCDPLQLLEVIAAMIGEDLATPAFIGEQRKRSQQIEQRVEQLGRAA